MSSRSKQSKRAKSTRNGKRLTKKAVSPGTTASPKFSTTETVPSRNRTDEDAEIVSYFKSSFVCLSNIAKVDPGRVMSPELALAGLELCNRALDYLLVQDSFGVSRIARVVGESDQDAWAETARLSELRWTERIAEFLTSQAMALNERLRAGRCSIMDESKYAVLGRQISTATGKLIRRNLAINQLEWLRHAPHCVNRGFLGVLDQLETTYQEFQQQVYLKQGIQEKFQLWYLLWINLKKTFDLLEKNKCGFPSTLYDIETVFFSEPATRNMFRCVFIHPEIFCPQEIEDLVGQYCKVIDDFLGEKALYPVRLTSFDRCSEISQASLCTLLSFPKGDGWNSKALEAMRHAAARLNYLNGKPSVLRRLGGRFTLLLQDASGKENEDSMPAIPASPVWLSTSTLWEAAALPVSKTGSLSGAGRHIPHEVPLNHNENSDSLIQKLNKAVNGDPATEVFNDELRQGRLESDSMSNVSHMDIESNTFENYAPAGRNIVSAYDYVHCPIPENRAYEVANSRLIARDLRDPEYISQGLRVEDIVNLPPLHCQTPGTWTAWRRRTRLGPYEAFSLLSSAVLKNILGKARSSISQRPLAPPHITSRSEGRHYKHDRNRRVIKRTPRRRVSLRGGGGPRYVPAYDETPSHSPRNNPARHVRRWFWFSSPRDSLRDSDERNPTPENWRPGGSDFEIFEDSNAASSATDRTRSSSHPFNQGTRDLERGSQAATNSQANSPADSQQADLQESANSLGERPALCHPCPTYEGQYHHFCDVTCSGLDKTLQIKHSGGDNNQHLFEGSLWELTEQGYQRCGSVKSLEEFIANNRRLDTGTQRSFLVSNGAELTIGSTQTNFVVDLKTQPHPDWLPFSGDLDPDRPENQSRPILGSLPNDLTYVEVKAVGEDDFEILGEQGRPFDVDVFLSAYWKNGTIFRLNCGNPKRIIYVKLERLRRKPWERLVVLTPPELVYADSSHTQTNPLPSINQNNKSNSAPNRNPSLSSMESGRFSPSRPDRTAQNNKQDSQTARKAPSKSPVTNDEESQDELANSSDNPNQDNQGGNGNADDDDRGGNGNQDEDEDSVTATKPANNRSKNKGGRKRGSKGNPGSSYVNDKQKRAPRAKRGKSNPSSTGTKGRGGTKRGAKTRSRGRGRQRS